MRKNICVILILIFCSCNSDKHKTIAHGDRTIKPLKSISASENQKGIVDTFGLYKAPIKILSAKLVEKKNSEGKYLRLTYKNISSKALCSINFKLYGLNTAGKLADVKNSSFGIDGCGYDIEMLKSEKILSEEQGLGKVDLKTLVLVWPIDVEFSDGTKWKLNNIK
jgi:hypothetical protein